MGEKIRGSKMFLRGRERRVRKRKTLGELLHRWPRRPAGDEPRTTAVVLSGGGHLGAIHVGQLRALVEAGVTADVYIATSVGALNAAVVAARPGMAGVDRLHEIWRGLRTDDIFPGGTVQQAWKIARGHDHLYPNDGMVRLITSAIPVTNFSDLKVPLRIVTAELDSGEERVFASGSLLRPLLATTALPGVFPPVRIADKTFVDGGIVNNVPISHAVDADRVFVLELQELSSETLPTSSFGMLLRSFAISRSSRFRLDIERYAGATEFHVIPQPEIPDIRFPDLSHSPELMELGYRVARDYLREALGPSDATSPAVDPLAGTGRRPEELTEDVTGSEAFAF
jgi:NTE family protein